MIAVIAGTGVLPLEACKSLREANKKFFVITLFPEDNGQCLQDSLGADHDIITQKFYKPSTILQLLKQRHATQVLFIGKVDKQNLYRPVAFDWLALKLLGSLACKSDATIMDLLATELSKHGIGVLRQDEILARSLLPPGIITGTLTSAQHDDCVIGLHAAQILAQNGIGQTVVVKDGTVLAVEALEGTDACIKRALALAGNGLIVCKAAAPDHNTRYDIPTLGPATIASYKMGDISVIAWQATVTLIADKERFISMANELDIALVSCTINTHPFKIFY